MTEPKIGRFARIVEVTLCIVAVPILLGFLYGLVRFIRWGLDRNYHLFRK
jgi:hypothetical protein